MAAGFPMAFGLAEVLVLLLSGGGVGLPLGVPPQPEDPVLANVAPEECLLYTTWSGMAACDPASANATERLLGDPEIRQAASEAVARVEQALRRLAAERGDSRASLVARHVPELAKIVLTHAAAVYVSKIAIDPAGVVGARTQPVNPAFVEFETVIKRDAVEIDAAAVVQLGGQSDDVRRRLTELQDAFTSRAAERVSIGGTDFQRLPLAPKAPPLVWGIHGDYLVLGLGDRSVAGLLERMQAQPPKWLAELREQLPIARRSTVSYLNLREMRKLGLAIANQPQIEKGLEAAGLSALVAYESSGGLDEQGFVCKSLIRLEGEPQGLLSVCRGKGLQPADLAGIPEDAMLAFALQLNGKDLLENIVELLNRLEPRAAADFEKGLEEVEQNLGLNLREDLLACLGDVWHVSTSPGGGGLLAGWTASVNVKDQQRLTATLNRTIGFFQGILARELRGPKIKQLSFAGRTVYFLDVPDPDFPLAPAWCVTESELLVALFPQAITARLHPDRGTRSLADRPEVSRLFSPDGAPLMLAYKDTRVLAELFYPLLQLLARMGGAQLERTRVDLGLDVSLVPSTGAISRHLRPSVAAVYLTPRGFECVTHQTLPGSAVGVSAPLTIGLLAPAVFNAQRAARRAQSANNLKQIGLSLHNYHDAFKAFPAAYSVDANGKPLLSWRVYVLPFLEQYDLYNQFHLDEPWDSEHNKQLIPRMPSVYRAPNSKAEPGKTVYLAPRHASGVIIPSTDRHASGRNPTGVGMARITDGTSNTILVVQASDDKAVEWTRPDDLEVDIDNARAALVGTGPNGIVALLCDGSVHYLPKDVDTQTLKSLLTRDGGEPVIPP